MNNLKVKMKATRNKEVDSIEIGRRSEKGQGTETVRCIMCIQWSPKLNITSMYSKHMLIKF